MNCIFCQIVQGKILSEIVFQNKEVIVFKDIHPKAQTHFLIVPKKHIESVNHLDNSDVNLIGQLVFIAKNVAQKFGIKNGYKLIFNVGRGGGQIIDHIHLHFLSEEKIS